ncbi:hypothetical protein [Marinomonas sp. PE14-40]|uniref:hypothetical protein n=1 Tax=Marinomonas sp. PE14-40 TaxID=3060621 RepID=UPI003F67722C
MFSQVIKHPLTIFLAGTLIAIILYFLAKSEAEPKYSVQVPRLLAEVTDKAEDLTLLWKKREIANLYTTDILIWNDGNDFIDKLMLSETDRLRICPNENTNILQARFTKTSRENLKFTLDKSETGNCLYINIVGDEAIESGGLINVLFSGNQDSEFTIYGRIKGYKDGFQAVQWVNSSKNEFLYNYGLYINIFLVGLVLIYGFSIIVRLYRKLRRSSNIHNKFKFYILNFMSLIIGVFFITMGLYSTYEIYNFILMDIDWAKG